MTRRDVVLVTVDSWRADSVARMPALRRLTAGAYERGEAIAGAAATHGAFPPLLASQHSIHSYEPDGSVRADVETLPDRLGDAGYATAGFVASNPFVSKWADRFDAFWNDGMRADDAGERWGYSTLDRAARFLTLRTRVSARSLAERAREWYETTAPPRFLWLHLMDTHGPYFPGLRRARRVGLARTYRTLFAYHVRDTPYERVQDGLRALYRQCVGRLDAQLPDVLEFVADDAAVVLTADHGEEFDHGYHPHGQLYDETVRVPLFTRGLDLSPDAPVRHLDLPPTVLDAVGVKAPDGWRGRPADGDARDAFLTNHSPRLGRSFVGVRTDRHKLVRSYDDESWTVTDRELYDVAADPAERDPITDRETREELGGRLDDFLADPAADLDVIRETNAGIDEDVADRLRELGYVTDGGA